MIDALYPSCKGSTIFKYLEAEELDVPKSSNYTPELDLNLGNDIAVETSIDFVPQSLSEISADKGTVAELMSALPTYSKSEIDIIEKRTRGQSVNDEWIQFRAGMITASNLKSVVTRHNTLNDSQSSKSKDTEPIVKKLMGYTKLDPNLPALKYGRLTEPVARSAYMKLFCARRVTRV